jgi:hypothetical protein
MLDPSEMTRQDAIDRLHDFGIYGEQVYLIDLIPLLEMIWSDGYAQQSEINIFETYLTQHVARINGLAGYKILTIESAHAFVQRFLTDRPSEKLMETLRSLLPPVRLASSDTDGNEQLRSSVLQGCLDIAASSVTHDPSEAVDRFCSAEKQCWFEIFDTLHGTEHGLHVSPSTSSPF